MSCNTSSSHNQEKKYEEKIASAKKNEHSNTSENQDTSFQKEQDFLLQKKAKAYNSEVERTILERYQINTTLRIKYARKIFCYLYLFSLLCFLIIFFQGFHLRGFNLDKTAITTLIGGFAVSVISLVKIILKGLFLPEEKSLLQQIKKRLLPSNTKDKP